MKRETIIQILRIYTTSPESTREKIAEAILKYQKINMPTEEEIDQKYPIFSSGRETIEQYVKEAENAKIREALKWMRFEIESRNK